MPWKNRELMWQGAAGCLLRTDNTLLSIGDIWWGKRFVYVFTL